MRLLPSLATLCVFGVLGWCTLPQVIARAARPRSFGAPASFAKLADTRIDESSGLAPSRTFAGIYYTHNDSGDSARVFAFDKTGKTLATINLSGTKAIDCEDIASTKSHLYLGDIGDNAEKRKTILIYRFAEPKKLDGEMTVEPEILELSYPDGPHNAETLLVHPSTGALTIVTKTSSGASGIYQLENVRGAGKYTLKKVGSVEIASFIKEGKLLTGGDYSPDGKFVVLRTYLQGYEYANPVNGEWWKSKPASIRTALEFQGEAITYSSSGDSILTSTEGKPCAVSQITVKK